MTTEQSPAARKSGPTAELWPIFAVMTQPVFTIDANGYIGYANQAAVAALGYAESTELEQRPCCATIHHETSDGPHHPDGRCPMEHAASSGGAFHGERDWFVGHEGSPFLVDYRAVPVDSRTGPGAVVAFNQVRESPHETLRRTFAAADALRARWSRDLHDGAQQQLSNTILFLGRAKQVWGAAPDEALRLIGLAMDEANKGIGQLRELTADCYPALLRNRGLAAALEALAERLPFPLERDIAEISLPDSVEASVYFFLVDTIASATDGHRPSVVRVETKATDDQLIIEVRVDGVTIGQTDVVQRLTGVTDRLEALGGEVQVSMVNGGLAVSGRILRRV